MIRLAPTVVAMLVRVQMRTDAIPALSSSFTIVAPQRVPVPQVEVNMTPTSSLDALADILGNRPSEAPGILDRGRIAGGRVENLGDPANGLLPLQIA